MVQDEMNKNNVCISKVSYMIIDIQLTKKYLQKISNLWLLSEQNITFTQI
jgi:hypothetical protein